MTVKVCGVRDCENIGLLEKMDIDILGFIFYAGSPRYVYLQDVKPDDIAPCTKPKAGVFVNAPVEEILLEYERCQLDYVQLHGDESPDFCGSLQKEGCRVIKAFSIASADDLRQTAQYGECADLFLFDTKSGGYGGSGKRFDWAVLEAYKGEVPFLLSGGIGAEHVNDLKSFYHPRLKGIDVNSRFETAPGLKDALMLEQFLDELDDCGWRGKIILRRN